MYTFYQWHWCPWPQMNNLLEGWLILARFKSPSCSDSYSKPLAIQPDVETWASRKQSPNELKRKKYFFSYFLKKKKKKLGIHRASTPGHPSGANLASNLREVRDILI